MWKVLDIRLEVAVNWHQGFNDCGFISNSKEEGLGFCFYSESLEESN